GDGGEGGRSRACGRRHHRHSQRVSVPAVLSQCAHGEPAWEWLSRALRVGGQIAPGQAIGLGGLLPVGNECQCAPGYTGAGEIGSGNAGAETLWAVPLPETWPNAGTAPDASSLRSSLTAASSGR